MLEHITEPDLNLRLITEQKLILLDFYANWCGPCQRMQPVLESVAATCAEQVVVLKVDVDHPENRRLSAHHHVKNLPTLLLFRRSTEIARRVGSQTADQLERLILAS